MWIHEPLPIFVRARKYKHIIIKVIFVSQLLTKKDSAILAGRRIKAVRQLMGYSCPDFAAKTGISQHTLHSWESAKTCLTEKGAQKLVKSVEGLGIDCCASWLLSGEGRSPLRVDFDSPTSNTDAASALPSNYAARRVEKESIYFLEGSPNSTSLLISDSSMSPVFEVGDIIGGVEEKDHVAGIFQGSIYIVQTATEKLIRRLYTSDQGYILIPEEATAHPTHVLQEIEKLFLVVWARKRSFS